MTDFMKKNDAFQESQDWGRILAIHAPSSFIINRFSSGAVGNALYMVFNVPPTYSSPFSLTWKLNSAKGAPALSASLCIPRLKSSVDLTVLYQICFKLLD